MMDMGKLHWHPVYQKLTNDNSDQKVHFQDTFAVWWAFLSGQQCHTWIWIFGNASKLIPISITVEIPPCLLTLQLNQGAFR